MKMKKLRACILSAAIAAAAMAAPAFAAENIPDWDNNSGMTVVAYGIGENGKDVYSATLKEALTAVYMSSPAEVVTIECKAEADVGEMTHGHVADSLNIIGNGAYVSGGEYDMEIDTCKFDRSTGKQSSGSESDLDKNITVTVKDLNGIAAWGQRKTNHTVNLEFTNCKNMNRVYFTGTGTNNIKLENCTFDSSQGSHPNTSIYSNQTGTIEVNNCSFTGIAIAVNLKNKSDGDQNVTVSNCIFNDCSTKALAEKTSSAGYAAPIRLLTSGAGTTTANVSNCTILYSEGNGNVGNGDILIGEGRKDVKITPNVILNVSGTAAELQIQQSGAPEATVKNNIAKEDALTVAGAASETVINGTEEGLGDVMTENGFEAAEGTAVRGDKITLKNFAAKSANIRYNAGADKYFDVAFDMGDITAKGDVTFGVLLYNIPTGITVSNPTVYLQ